MTIEEFMVKQENVNMHFLARIGALENRLQTLRDMFDIMHNSYRGFKYEVERKLPINQTGTANLAEGGAGQ